MRARARAGREKKPEFIPHIEYRDKLECIPIYFDATNMAIHIGKFISSKFIRVPRIQDNAAMTSFDDFQDSFCRRSRRLSIRVQINSRVDPFRSSLLGDFRALHFLRMFKHALGKKRVLIIIRAYVAHTKRKRGR